MNLIAWSERRGQVPRRVLVDVNCDVRPDRVLLGDDSKAKAAIAAGKGRQDGTGGGTAPPAFMFFSPGWGNGTGGQNLHGYQLRRPRGENPCPRVSKRPPRPP